MVEQVGRNHSNVDRVTKEHSSVSLSYIWPAEVPTCTTVSLFAGPEAHSLSRVGHIWSRRTTRVRQTWDELYHFAVNVGANAVFMRSSNMELNQASCQVTISRLARDSRPSEELKHSFMVDDPVNICRESDVLQTLRSSASAIQQDDLYHCGCGPRVLT